MKREYDIEEIMESIKEETYGNITVAEDVEQYVYTKEQ